MLDTYKVENMMDSWAVNDSAENGLNSSGYDTLDCDTIGAMIFLGLLYADSCSKWFFLVLIACVCLCSIPSSSQIRGLTF